MLHNLLHYLIFTKGNKRIETIVLIGILNVRTLKVQIDIFMLLHRECL